METMQNEDDKRREEMLKRLQERENRKNRIDRKLTELQEKGVKEAILITSDGTREKHRFGQTGYGQFLIMAPRKKRRGYLIDYNVYVDAEAPQTRTVNKADEWTKQMKRAYRMLSESGLWPEINTSIEIGLEFGYDRMQELLEIVRSPLEYREKIEKLRSIDPRLIVKSKFDPNEDAIRGDLFDEFLWYPIKIKKMYFGKHWTPMRLQQIADALAKGQDLRISRDRTSYDVSFEYNAAKKMA